LPGRKKSAVKFEAGHRHEFFVVKMISGANFRLVTHLKLLCSAWPGFLLTEWNERLCRCGTEGQHPASALSALQKARPILHHPGARLQIEGMIAGRAHRIPGPMCKLQFDMVMRVTLLVQDGGRQPAKEFWRGTGRMT